MMEREAFVSPRRARWEALEALLSAKGAYDAREWAELASRYRGICADLAQARAHDMAPDVQAYLDNLTSQAHHRLYSIRPRPSTRAFWSLISDVPREVRRCSAFFWCASALFYVPFILCALLSFWSEPFAYAVLPAESLEAMYESYREAPADRGLGGDAQMAGFYLYNNVGIGLRCFVTGALAGLGPLYFLVYNGAMIGTTFGRLFAEGMGGNLLEFTSGHTAWELTGIVLSGTAGLRLGWSVIDTGQRRRLDSVRASSGEVYRLALGAVFMLLVAAAIEGFWSAGPAPRSVKMLFGLFQALLVACWLLLGGREGEA